MQIGEEALLNLVSVLRLNIPIAKGSLPRLFLNLSLHSATRASLLRILLSLLRLSLGAAEADDLPRSNAGMEDHEQPGTRSLDDALQVAAELLNIIHAACCA